MAEIATIARPYAEAIFKVAKAQNKLAPWGEVLAALALAAGDVKVQLLADDPKVLDAQMVDLLMSVVKSAAVPAEEAKRFVAELVTHGRLTALPEIATQYHELCDATQDVVEVMIYSAFPMNETQVAQILPTLEKRFGQKLKPQVRIDESLIGGICAVVGDDTLDMSVKARLDQMKAALIA